MPQTSADRAALTSGGTGARADTPRTPSSLPAAGDRRGRLEGLSGQIVLAVLAGLAVGALTSVGQTFFGSTALAGLGNAVSPWLVLPFVVGALTRRDRHASAVGLVACVAQVLGYHLVADLRGFGVSTAFLVIWTFAGVFGGPLFGWAGRAWRSRTGRLRGFGPALLVGCWVSEAVVTYVVVLGYGGDAAVFGVVAAMLTAILGVTGRQLRSLLTWLPVTCLLGAVGFAALHTLL